MPNEWIIALKKWNTGKDTWCLPRKGSKAYDEVRGLMPEKKLKAPAMPEKASAPAPAMPEPSKSKGPKIAPKKAVPAPPAPPMKIPMEPQRKPMGDKDAPKVKFVEPAPAKKAMSKELPKLSKEGEALQTFGHFIWRRFDSGDTEGMKKNVRRTKNGIHPIYAMDLVKVEDRFPGYWEDWNPIIGLKIPGVSGKALATCNPDGTISFTNIMLEEKEEASYSAINDAVVREYREYGVGDLQSRYKKIAQALTSMEVLNKGKKSQGVKKPSKEEIENFVMSEIARLGLKK